MSAVVVVVVVSLSQIRLRRTLSGPSSIMIIPFGPRDILNLIEVACLVWFMHHVLVQHGPNLEWTLCVTSKFPTSPSFLHHASPSV